VGFEVVHELGNNGIFYYPKEDLTATALLIKDLQEIPAALPSERIAIDAIRNNLTGTAVERGPKGTMEFIYDLQVK
jgi:hypothetical protein